MARGERVAVGVTPTLITSAEVDPTAGSSAVIKNLGPAAVDIGGVTVASGAGYPLAMDDELYVDLSGTRDNLYAICAAATTADLAVLRTGV